MKWMMLVVWLVTAQVHAQTIKLATLAPEGSVWHTALERVSSRWQELSNGAVRLRIYPSGVVGDDAVMVRKLRIGQIHGAALTSEGLAAIVPEMRVFQTPMFVRTDQELDALRRHLHDRLAVLMLEQGFRLLGWSDVGWVYLFSNTAVTTPAQAQQLKMWIHAGDTAWAEALKSAGYRPVPLPVTEIHMGLKSGMLDAFNAPPVLALSTQWFAQANHMMNLKWAPLTGAVVITEDQWQRVAPDLRERLLQAVVSATADAAQEVRGFEADAVAAMGRHGLTVHEVSDAAAAEFTVQIAQSYDRIVGEVVPADVHAAAEVFLHEYRRSH